ncbi:MAG: methylated-DNA--[protein]-cysteine S-methyltransferase [Jatrophihabitans sp.]
MIATADKGKLMKHGHLVHSYLPSPVGTLLLTGDGEAITGLYTCEHVRLPTEIGERSDAAFTAAREQLGEYFAGDRTRFELPLAPAGTEFQHRVWQRLLAIELGSVRTYAQLAIELGNPKAARAVGLANGRNPISIVVPCHRLLGSDGTLTGYAGGLPTKQWLLSHERRVAGQPQPTAAGSRPQPSGTEPPTRVN